MAKRSKLNASKESAAEALQAFTGIIGRLHAEQALSLANNIRLVSAFIGAAKAKLPTNASYARDRIRKVS